MGRAKRDNTVGMAGNKTPKRQGGEWRPAFLAMLRKTCNVRESCKKAGVSRPVVYDHRDRDPAFRAQWDEAIVEAVELLEYVARRRAMRTSDTLLIFLLKAHKRDMYQDRKIVTLAGDAENPIHFVAIKTDARRKKARE